MLRCHWYKCNDATHHDRTRNRPAVRLFALGRFALIAVLAVAWQYDMRRLLLFSFGVAALDIVWYMWSSPADRPALPLIAGKLFAHVAQSAAPPATGAAGRAQAEELSEREVLRPLAQGLANAEIARRLYLSGGTVRNYVSTIFDKLAVADRTQAALAALRLGLAELHQPE